MKQIKYCQMCGKMILRNCGNGVFCSRKCADKARKLEVVRQCRPGQACFNCPYPDCRKGTRSRQVTQEETHMRQCGEYVPPRQGKPSYYIAEVKINIDVCLREIREEDDYE